MQRERGCWLARQRWPSARSPGPARCLGTVAEKGMSHCPRSPGLGQHGLCSPRTSRDQALQRLPPGGTWAGRVSRTGRFTHGVGDPVQSRYPAAIPGLICLSVKPTPRYSQFLSSFLPIAGGCTQEMTCVRPSVYLHTMPRPGHGLLCLSRLSSWYFSSHQCLKGAQVTVASVCSTDACPRKRMFGDPGTVISSLRDRKQAARPLRTSVSL